DLDLSTRPFAEQDTVANLEIDRDQLAALVATTWANGDHFALRGLFLGRVRNDDAASGLLFGLNALDHDAVVERTEYHAILLGFFDYFWIGSRNQRVLADLHINLCHRGARASAENV